MKKVTLSFIGLMLALVLAPNVLGQTGENQRASLSGKYEGVGKGTDGEVKIALELTDDAGKFSGRITTPRGVYEMVKGQLAADGLLSLQFDDKRAGAKLDLRLKGDKLIGELTADGKKGSVELHKVIQDDLSGVWDAVAETQSDPVPFTLTLRLDGEKVTGSSSSQLGDSTISTGTWKDGKLSLVLDSGNGQIVLAATLTEGKLVGDYDYAGQAEGKWTGVKKKQ